MMKSTKGVSAHRHDEPMQMTDWVRLRAGDKQGLSKAEAQFGIRLNQKITHAIEENGFVLLPVAMPLRDGALFTEIAILMAIGHGQLITVEPDGSVSPMDQAATRIRQLPNSQTSHAALVLILEALINSMHDVVDRISLELDDLAQEAVANGGGFELKGRQVGVADIADTAIALGETEELVARAIQGQLMIERAIRWVRRTMKAADLDVSAMLLDVQGGRRHAQYQHAKVRNVQQSLMTTLDLKQSQIIKVFTIVTAVFTPPTLIAAFYGQNFAYMPELKLPWGEWVVMASTAFFALAPLLYIRRKGWLR